MIFTEDQENALNVVVDWYNRKFREPYIYIAGFAGVGKTTFIKSLKNLLTENTVYASFTGKAAQVLESKGCIPASTVHGLIYIPIEDSDGNVKFVLSPKDMLAGIELIILDEASMISDALAQDLLSLDIPILAIGDPAQLPPVEGSGFFTRNEPSYMMRNIVRQALDSDIIRVSKEIREGKEISYQVGKDVAIIPMSKFDIASLGKFDQIICGTNKTRQTLNSKYRELQGISGSPLTIGEKVIATMNNYKYPVKIFNGSLWNVTKFGKGRYPNTTNLCIENPKETIKDVMTHDDCFLGRFVEAKKAFRQSHVQKQFVPFDYGYAITAHKSQGSQWDSVLIFDESNIFFDLKKEWLYTAVTRAAKKVVVVK